MLSTILKAFSAPEPQPFGEEDAREALCALLVRIARADGEYAAVEMEVIDRILAARYGLSPEEARRLRATGEEIEAQAPDTVRFTRVIKDTVPYEAREAVVHAAWRVVLADGGRADEEDALMRLVASLLGVNDRDSNIARLKAAKE